MKRKRLALAALLVAELAMPVDLDNSRPARLAFGAAEKVIIFALLIYLVLRLRSCIAAERARALTDPVTGLPNRRAFKAAIARAAGTPGSSKRPSCCASSRAA